MDFGARVVIQDSASGQWCGRRTDDPYDERSICTTNGSHWPTRSLEDYGSEASHVALVPGESGTVVDRRRARKAAQAASTSTMEAACDQSRRPRCWPLGRGGAPGARLQRFRFGLLSTLCSTSDGGRERDRGYRGPEDPSSSSSRNGASTIFRSRVVCRARPGALLGEIGRHFVPVFTARGPRKWSGRGRQVESVSGLRCGAAGLHRDRPAS